MSFKKWMPWDFLKNNSSILDGDNDKLGLQFDDPVIEKLTLDILVKKSSDHFKKVFYAGSHDACLLAVLNKQSDVCGMSSRSPEKVSFGVVYRSTKFHASATHIKKNIPKS